MYWILSLYISFRFWFVMLFSLFIERLVFVPGPRQFGFWFLFFLVYYAATQLTFPLHLERIQVVCSNMVSQKRQLALFVTMPYAPTPPPSPGTPRPAWRLPFRWNGISWKAFPHGKRVFLNWKCQIREFRALRMKWKEVLQRDFSQQNFKKESNDPHHPIQSIPKTDMGFPCWNSQSFHLHSWRVSCFTTHVMSWHVHRARPLNGFENGPNLAENRIEHVLLTSWDGNSIFFSANRARPSSQKLQLNVFTEWNFLRNEERAYQIWE